MDLFTVIVPEHKLHPQFKKIATTPEYEQARLVINGWSEGLLTRKKESLKFVKEFQISFNSSFWELYLNVAFKKLGLEIDYSKSSPDFNVTHPSGCVVNVEAVTSNHRLNESSEYYDHAARSAQMLGDENSFLNSSTVKLVGKIKDKLALYIGDGKKHPYSSLEHVKGNPFVIAICPFDSHISHFQNNRVINRVLYGIDTHPDGREENIDFVLSNNNEKIKLGLFAGDSCGELSAVIFSTLGMFGKSLVQASTPGTIRATKYRELGIVEFMAKEGIKKLGFSYVKMNSAHEVSSIRFFNGYRICGSDTHIYDASMHSESHLDGLHVYYNPYAKLPLPRDVFAATEITQNDYDIKNGRMLASHSDGSLVSRVYWSE